MKHDENIARRIMYQTRVDLASMNVTSFTLGLNSKVRKVVGLFFPRLSGLKVMPYIYNAD